jgi:hypothetical protein
MIGASRATSSRIALAKSAELEPTAIGPLALNYETASSSTSKVSVAFGGMTSPAPASP